MTCAVITFDPPDARKYYGGPFTDLNNRSPDIHGWPARLEPVTSATWRTTKMASVPSTELAKRVFPITSEFSSYKAGDRNYDKDGLRAAGLQTEATVVVPMFHKDDFKSVGDFKKGVDRVMAEWEKARELSRNGNTVQGKDGKSYVLADPTADEDHNTRFLDFLSDIIHSGVSLAHQQVLGNRMRTAAKTKLGAPSGASGVGRGKRAEAEV